MHGGGEEEGWGANLASTVLLLDALVRGGNPGAVWYKPDLPQRPHPLARWLGAHRSAVLVVQICAPCISFRCRSPGAHENPVRVLRAPSERADGDAEASRVCTKWHRVCYLAENHLVEARYWLSLHQSLFFSYTVHGAPLLLCEKKRRGVHLGQDGKSLPCCRKTKIISYNRKHPPPFCLFPRNQTVP